MGRRDELMASYKADLEKLGLTPDEALLEKVVKACGPAIYSDDAATVAASDKTECARIRDNFIMKKLGMTDAAQADAALDKAVETYGRSNRNKQRAVLYYLIAQEVGGL